MKFFTPVMFLAFGQTVLSVVFNNPKCQANNCARAVTGTVTGKIPAITSREEDCSSFLLVTMTPPTSTSTTTTTVTTTVSMMVSKRGGELVLRILTDTPPTVPTYASACPGTSAYESACSCWSITPVTIVAPTPITVSTTTSTTTVTSMATTTV